jgi:methyltransferase (TIGR00027 family)
MSVRFLADGDGMSRHSASRTAEYMALFRALETSRRPSRTRLFEDPFAYGFLSPSLRAVVRLSRMPLGASPVSWFIDWRWPGARASGIARTRLIDDALDDAVRDGVSQVVILGAGFDSRGCRMSRKENARVFEVDHPATLAVKKNTLMRMLGRLPANVAFVETDFNRQPLDEAMDSSGFDPRAHTFFIWEGVTNYLTGSAVDATLSYLATAGAPGSRIVFTYIHSDVLRNPAGFEGAEKSLSVVERGGERWTFGIDPMDLRAYLAEHGFELIDDVGSLEYRARYMKRSGLHMRGYEFYRAALAQIPETTDESGCSAQAEATLSAR